MLTPPPHARALIFDCDGTLAQTRDVHFAAFETAFAAAGLVLRREWYFQRLGLSLDPLCAAFEAEFGMLCPPEAIRAIYAREVPVHLALARPVAPVLEIARTHHGRLP